MCVRVRLTQTAMQRVAELEAALQRSELQSSSLAAAAAAAATFHNQQCVPVPLATTTTPAHLFAAPASHSLPSLALHAATCTTGARWRRRSTTTTRTTTRP